jgi:hypothetical protein
MKFIKNHDSKQSETHQIIENRLSMKQKERKEKKNE